MGARAFLGLGTNLGDRLANLQRAVDLLAAMPGVRVIRSSRIYETAPVGPPQPDFLNAVIEVDTDLEPHDLLAAAADVERSLHRVRDVRWGPRTIDVDVLTFGDRVIDTPDLTVPHPRMHERAFVLAPLMDLEPDPPLPGGRHARDLSTEGWSADVRLVAPPLRVA
jgi:2-amino-4-hydroxy-6-hydroxymethyldihydropteridine diphosphokinase